MTDNPEHVARLDLEVDIVEGLERFAFRYRVSTKSSQRVEGGLLQAMQLAEPELFRDVIDFDDRHCQWESYEAIVR